MLRGDKVVTDEATFADDGFALVGEMDNTDEKGGCEDEDKEDETGNLDLSIKETRRLHAMLSDSVNVFLSRSRGARIGSKGKLRTEEDKQQINNLAEKLRLKAQMARKEGDHALGTLNNQLDSAHIQTPSLNDIILSKKFMLYQNRYADAQMNRTLKFPTLPQPVSDIDADEAEKTEMSRTRSSHRFIITADTQFGVLMDGFLMEDPNWDEEINISRECVRQINVMKGDERPLFVCVCGDLLDTEGSFGEAHASWKNVMKDWERHSIFGQQIKDWKEVWSHLDEDIGLVCLCGNHDVGNRPTAASIKHWTSAFGNDYLAFWVNGTYNIGLNNCIFSDPSGAMDLCEEQLKWLEGRLEYASARHASQVFVYSHYPWFITNEDEDDMTMNSVSLPPAGWGGKDRKFPDSYFNIPIEIRKVVLSLFRKHNVKACFSGHFHQNVISETSWGMPMIITAPLSMMLKSTSQLSLEKEEHKLGFRTVDVHESSFCHKFIPLENQFCEDCNNIQEDS